MNKLDALIAELCPQGVERKRLGDIGVVVRGNGLQKKDFTESGVGCIHYGQIYTYYGTCAYKTKSFVSHELAEKLQKVNKGDLVIAVTSENVEDVGKCVVWLGDEQIVTGAHAAIFRHNQDPKYVAYWFQTNDFFTQKKRIAKGTKVIDLTPQKLEEVTMPVPPLPVQREIVRILDNFAELTAELTARKKQYEFYRDKLLTYKNSTKHGKIIDMLAQPITDGPHTTPKLVDSGVPFLSAEAIYDGRIHFEKKRGFITEEFDSECCKKYKPQKNDVFMVKSGSTTGKVGFVDTDIRFNIWSPLAAMRTNENNSPRFLFHLLQSESIQKQVQAKASHGSQPNLSMRASSIFAAASCTLSYRQQTALHLVSMILVQRSFWTCFRISLTLPVVNLGRPFTEEKRKSPVPFWGKPLFHIFQKSN